MRHRPLFMSFSLCLSACSSNILHGPSIQEGPPSAIDGPDAEVAPGSPSDPASAGNGAAEPEASAAADAGAYASDAAAASGDAGAVDAGAVAADDGGTTSLDTRLTTALRTGDPKQLTENDALDAALVECDALRQERIATLSAILGDSAIDYTPGTGSQLVVAQQEQNPHFGPLIVGTKGHPLAGAGFVGKTRVLAFGSNPVDWQSAGSDANLGGVATAALTWLAGEAAPSRIALSRFGGSEAGMRAFVTAQFPAATVVACNDSDTMTACIAEQSLILVGSDAGSGLGTADERNARSKVALQSALAAGQPLGYFHTGSWGEGSSSFVGDLLGFSLPYAGNYFAADAAHWSSRAQMSAAYPKQTHPDQALCSALQHFKRADYDFDWSACSDRTCTQLADFQTDFMDGANDIKTRIAGLETRAQGVFDAGSPLLTKLAVLVGDLFRAKVAFPIDKTKDTMAFMRALWADHALATLRAVNPAENLLNSSFSPVIPETTPTYELTRSWQTRTKGFSSSSASYALPGRSFKVTRTDSGTSTVNVFVNMIRTGANHAIDWSPYQRPMHLWGNAIPLKAGESVILTHAIGGIIFAELEGTSSTQTVTLQLSGVGQHPTYSGGDSRAFVDALANTPYGWAELLTPGVEVHSTLAHMKSSVNAYAGDAERLVSDTWNYYYKNIYSLAGFLGRDLSHTSTITTFCAAHAWNCEDSATQGLSWLQHFNADQPNCGWLCSGNPIDSGGYFLPYGWGEAHELGHNLQYSEFAIHGGLSSEVSNNVFPTYVWLKWNADHPSALQGRAIQQKDAFTLLQNARLQLSPSEYVASKLWNSSDDSYFWARLVFYWQAALTSADVAGLGDGGWDLYRLMYIRARLLWSAKSSASTWTSERAKLGYTSDAYADRNTTVSANDHFLIAMSYITSRDQRPFFDMWGVSYSSDASAQVAAYGFPAAAQRFYVVPCEDDAFSAPLTSALAVDGETSWPTAANCQ